MENINWNEVEDIDNNYIPEGIHPVTVKEITISNTQNNNEKWHILFEISTGPNKGKIIHDNFFWTQKAISRIKLFASKAGIKLSNNVILKQEMLIGRNLYVKTYQKSYHDNDGNEKKVAEVEFKGFISAAEIEGQQTQETKQTTKTPDESPF